MKSVTTVSSLQQNDFIFIGTIEELLSKGLPKLNILGQCGVYSISLPKNYIPNYISPAWARKNKNVIKPWSVSKLKEKWVEDAEIVYLGLAAGRKKPRSLRERLNDLLRHGNGKITKRGPHSGGEILWQLRGYERFGLWYKATGNPPEPKNYERQLLEAFKKHTGKLPFANRKFDC